MRAQQLQQRQQEQKEDVHDARGRSAPVLYVFHVPVTRAGSSNAQGPRRVFTCQATQQTRLSSLQSTLALGRSSSWQK